MQGRSNNMTQKSVEVFLDILTDEEVNNRLSREIFKLLTSIGIREKYYTEGTNHIRAFTKGNESEISEKVTRIEKLPHVKRILKEILVPV